SVAAGPTFMRTPSAVVFDASSSWDSAAVESAVTAVVNPLWTAAGLGAGWTADNVAGAAVRRLDGLGKLYVAHRGNLLFLANDAPLLGTMLQRPLGATAGSAEITYAAGFRHARERANYERMMTALDFAGPAAQLNYGLVASRSDAPAFFSQDLASLSAALAPLREIDIT